MKGMGVEVGPLKVGENGGNTVIATAGGAAVALPTCSNGERPRFIYATSTTNGTIRFGQSGVAAADTTDIFKRIQDGPLIFDVTGFTHARSDGGATWYLTALENGGGVG